MINGKTLKKSLSLLLTVLMVASLCAVCFGTFASAYTVYDTVFIDFENGKGVADSGGQAGSGIIADPADPDNMVYKFISGASSGSYAWGPVKSADADAGQDNIYKLLPSTTYTVSFKYKFGAGYANKDGGTASVMLYRGTTAAATGKKAISTKEANLDVDATNGTLIEGTTYYALKEDSEWFTYSCTFTTASSFLDGTVNKDSLFLFAQSHNVAGYSVNNPYYFDDVKITAKKATTETEAKTYVYDWKNEDGTAAYTNDHNVISFAGAPTNAGITEAMKNTSGLTSMGMIIGGATSIPGTISPSSMPSSSSWVHKASIFDDASKSLGNPNAARGSVKLEAGTNYMVSVKYIPLTIFGGKTISFGVGGFDRDASSFNTFDVKGNVRYTSAAYTQTTADDVADRDTFDAEDSVIKAAAENYIATYGWQEYTIAFTTSADYAPTHDVYLALNAATDGSDINGAGKCWLAQFLVESVTVSVVDDEYVFVDKYVEGVKTTVTMKPGDALPTPPTSSLGEEATGWVKIVDGALVPITAVPETNVAVYANYPTKVFEFEDKGSYYNPRNQFNGLPNFGGFSGTQWRQDDTDGNKGGVLSLGGNNSAATSATFNGATANFGLSAIPGAGNAAGFKPTNGVQYKVSIDYCVRVTHETSPCANFSIYLADVYGVGAASHKTSYKNKVPADGVNTKDKEKVWQTAELIFTAPTTFVSCSDSGHDAGLARDTIIIAFNFGTSPANDDMVCSCVYIDRITVEEVTTVTYIDGTSTKEEYVKNNSLLTLPEPKGDEFLYWKHNATNKMYQAGDKVEITGSVSFTAVYSQHYNFINDTTGESKFTKANTKHGIFSLSDSANSYKSYLITDTDESGKYTGGVVFTSTSPAYTDTVAGRSKADWRHKVMLYDPDVNDGAYLAVADNSYYEFKVIYRNKAAKGANSGIYISIGTGAPSNDGIGAVLYTDPYNFSKADGSDEWVTFTSYFDSATQIPNAYNSTTMTSSVGKGLAISGAGACCVEIKEVIVNVYTRTDSEVFVKASDANGTTISAMTPGEALLPSTVKNSRGEASMGWYNGADKVSVVPSESIDVCAKYPTTVIDFENWQGVADYNANGEIESGIFADPDDVTNVALRIKSGAFNGAYNWIPAAGNNVGYTIDSATSAYELKPNTKYRVSFKYKVEAGSANAAIVLYYANASDISGKVEKLKKTIIADETNGTLIEGTTTYAFNERTEWETHIFELTTPADLGTNTHFCFVNTQHGVSGYTTNNVYYFDDVVIEEVSAANEIYKAPVEEAKSSLRKESATQSAGLRFRGQINADVAVGADEIGFVTIPAQLLDQAGDDWYKLEGVDMTADKGKLASGAAYVKINDHKLDTGYYDSVNNGDSLQYQLCITGMNEKSKAAQFMTVMYIKTGEFYEYKFVNTMSYNNVKQVYEANGITGY